MNHTYRLIWNDLLQSWVAVAEFVRGRGKRARTQKRAVLGAVLAATALSAPYAQTLPSGGAVIQGQASISQSGNRLTVTQSSRNAVINWNNFSISSGAAAHFDNAGGATLNRVTGSLPSAIDGALTASGALYLVNRNGVIVGREGVINAAGFMASTLDVSDAEFMAGGSLRFAGDSLAGIVNLGRIEAASGDVLLVAHSVRNDGAITAAQGRAELLAGQEVFLASPDAPALLVSLGAGGTASATNATGVENTGLIEAAQARMQTANGNLYALAINQSGVIRATGVHNQDGRIVLTADGGTVRQDGLLTAHNADGAGGEILVGGDYQGKNAAVANAGRTIVTANARMDASAAAAQGDGGRVIVWADDSTTFAGRITARGGEQGGDGGFAEVSGKRTLDFRPDAPIDLSAKKGKTGTVLLDPNEMTVVSDAAGGNQISAATVVAGLASANYTISTSNFDPESGSGDIAVNADLAWNTANTLTLKSGNAIAINADITAANGALELYAGRYATAPDESSLGDVTGGASLSAGKTITVDRLRYGANAASLPVGYTLDPDLYTDSFDAYGNLHVGTLELDLSGGETGLGTYGDNNAIGALRTLGSGAMNWVEVTNHSGDLSLYLNSSDAYGLQIVTPGNLTLEAGSQLASTAGSFVLASTGGNFINQAIGNPLDLSGNASFLIYTGSQAGTAKGGLNGADEFSRTFTGNPPDDYNNNTSRFLFRDASSPSVQELTYRADNLSRHYGNANPALTYSVSGLQNGDLLQNVVSGAPLLSTTATMQSGVGQYAINISQGTLASASYGFQFINGTLTVNAAPLIIDIASLSRYYGDFNPTFSATASGLKNGDSLSSALAGFSLASSADRSSGVGAYAITANRNADDVNANYSLTFNPGTLTINPTPVTLTLGNTSMVYGDALPDFRNFATLTGAYNGDNLASAYPGASFTALATSAYPVGTYAVTTGSGFSNPNYVLTISSLGHLSITKAPLVIHANNASRYYGDANPAFTVASATGWKNGDTLAAIPDLVLTSSATAASNVGSYAIVPTGRAANYELVAGSGTLTVNKAPVNVYLNAATRYYGDADPLFTATYQGLKNGETALPGLYPVSNTNQYTPVGNYVVSAGGVTSFQNYLPTFHAGVLTVAPRPLTVAANDASRTYGDLNNPLLGVTVSGATAWDAAQAATFWAGSTSATQRSDAGSYAIDVTPNPYGNIQFDNQGNYAVSFIPGTLTVNRALAQIRANPVTMVWGDDRPPLTYDITGWLMPWDDAATVNSQGRAQLTSLAGGTLAAPGRYAITLANSTLGKNYYAVLDGNAQVEVLRRPITIVGDYVVPTVAQITDVHAAPMLPTPVIRYDANGNASVTYVTAPLSGGPQFDTVASSNGTRTGNDLFSYVGLPYVQPKLGTTLDDVLRYYDVTSQPGTARVSTGSSDLINRDWQPPPPDDFVIEVPKTESLNLVPMWGNNPSIDRLFEDVDRNPGDLLSLYDGLQKNGTLKTLSSEAQQLLAQASEAERVNVPLLQQIADSQTEIARLKEEKPANWQVLVASIEADIAGWRAQLQPGGLDTLRQLASAGDATALTAMTPLLSAGLMRALEQGKLPVDADNLLLDSINAQRTKLGEIVEAKYQAFLAKQDMREGSLTTVISSTKMPDLVGSAYVDLYTGMSEQDAALIAGGVGAAMAGTVVATGVLLAVGATYSSILVSTASTGVGAIALVAVAIGVAEAVQVFETEKNAQRYADFKEQNQQLISLDQLKLNDKDNRSQAAMAIQNLLAKTLSNMSSSEQGS